jgi:hypothetical protein
VLPATQTDTAANFQGPARYLIYDLLILWKLKYMEAILSHSTRVRSMSVISAAHVIPVNINNAHYRTSTGIFLFHSALSPGCVEQQLVELWRRRRL